MDALTHLRSSLSSRYAVEREIGRGGMATVYLARDIRHARNVALKVLNPELGAVLGVERFLSEIQVTANLQHPNLLPLFDSGEIDGALFYVMPYIEGESLRARLRKEKQLPVDEALHLAIAVAGALHYAHRHGVIHRDLKPENILMHEGQPMVADFGIALAVSAAGGERITQTGISLGTPHYMSPEQATGDRVVDQRSDIYSLGAVLYECLTGDPPHTASTAQAVIAKVLTDPVRSVRVSRPHVPPHVDEAIERSLEKLPADRWRTAQEFADALQGKSLTMSVAGRELLTGRWRARHRAARIARSPVFWAAAFVLAAGAALVQFSKRPAAGTDRPVRFMLTFPPGDRLSSQTSGGGRTLAMSADGGKTIYSSVGAGRPRRLLVRTLEDAMPRVLEGTEGATHPSFSPDGNWIAFVANQNLKKIPAAGGTVQVLADIGQQFGIDWAWDDRIVVSTGEGLVIVSAEGAVPVRRLTKQLSRIGTIRWPKVLPDGRTIAATMWTGALVSARLAIVSAESGEVTVLDVPGTSPLGMFDGHLLYATRNASLLAIPFDVQRRRVQGAPILVLDHVWVSGTGAAIADVSKNGSLVYQSGSSTGTLTLFDRNGALKPLLAEPRSYSQPRYSPDGRFVAVSVSGTATSDIHIYDVVAGTLTRLTTEGEVNDRPEWTPDGKRVLFRSERDDDQSLLWQPADFTGAAEPLLRLEHRNLWEGVIAPDGNTLVYRTGTIGTADIFYRRLTGDTTPRPISATPFTEWGARVSPDGRWVAYSSDDSRSMEVYVRPLGRPGGRIQVSVNGGTCPIWSRDGRTLYYANGQQFMAAAVTSTPTFGVTGRRVLFDADFVDTPGHANYDVSPAGDVLMVRPTVGSDQVMLVHNWRTELRERLARATSP